jgi:tape measure domain-containing protein
MNLFELLGIVNVNTSQAEKSLQALDNLGKRASGTLSNVAQTALGVASGMGLYKTFGEVMSYLQSVAIGFNSQLQQTNIAFTTMLGSSQKATQMLNELKDFAAKTPFEFPDLLTATTRLKAMGFATEKVIPTLRAIGDAAAGLGASRETINRLVLALGQMNAKGKVSGEEIRQLAEAGVPALDILAKGFGVTTGEMSNFIKKGVVPADKALNVLVSGLEERFPNMMKTMENTWQGVTSTIKDNVRFIVSDMTKNLFDKTLAQMVKVKDFTTDLYNSFKAGGFKQVLKDLVPDSLESQLQPLIQAWVDAFNSIKTATKDSIPVILDLMKDIAPIVAGAIKVLADLVKIAGEFADYVANNWSQLKPIILGVASAILTFKTGATIIGLVNTALALLNGTMGLTALSSGIMKGLSVAILELRTAPTMILGVKGALDALNLSFLATPVGWLVAGLTALVGITVGVALANKEAKKTQDALNKSMAENNQIAKEGIKVNDLEAKRQELETLKKLVAQYDMLKTAKEEDVGTDKWKSDAIEMQKINKQLKDMGLNYDLATQRIKIYSKAVEDATKVAKLMNEDEITSQMDLIDKKQENVKVTQDALDTYNELSGKTKLNTDETNRLKEATNLLSSMFGQHVTVRDKYGNAIKLNTNAIQDEINIQNKDIDNLKKITAEKISTTKQEITALMLKMQAVYAVAQAEEDAAAPTQSALRQNSRWLRESKVQVKDLQAYLTELDSLMVRLNKPTTTSSSTTPTTPTKYSKDDFLSTTSKDKGKSDAEKKAEEIKKMWEETAQAISTTMGNASNSIGTKSKEAFLSLQRDLVELKSQAEQLQKEGADKDGTLLKQVNTALGVVEQAVNDTTGTIGQKLLGYLVDASKTTATKITWDNQKSARDMQYAYEMAIENITARFKEMAEEVKQQHIADLNNLHNALMSALRNMYSQEETARVNAIRKEIEDEQDALQKKLDLIDEETKRKVKAKEDQIKALDDQLEAEDKAAQEYEHIAKLRELQVRLNEADSNEERLSISQDITDEINDYNRKMVVQQVEDKKDALEDEIKEIEDKADKQKETAKELAEYEIAQKQSYMDYLQNEYYPQLMSDQAIYQQASNLITTKNQAEILRILSNYGSGWNDLGISFGENLVNGMLPYLDELQRMIVNTLRDTQELIDAIEEANDLGGGTGGGGTGGGGNGDTQTYDTILLEQEETLGVLSTILNRSVSYLASLNNLPNDPSLWLPKGYVLKYHQGGEVKKNPGIEAIKPLFGLKNNEVPTILEEGEYVVKKDLVGGFKNFLANLTNLQTNARVGSLNNLPALAGVGSGGITVDVHDNVFRDGNDAGNKIASALKRLNL